MKMLPRLSIFSAIIGSIFLLAGCHGEPTNGPVMPPDEPHIKSTPQGNQIPAIQHTQTKPSSKNTEKHILQAGFFDNPKTAVFNNSTNNGVRYIKCVYGSSGNSCKESGTAQKPSQFAFACIIRLAEKPGTFAHELMKFHSVRVDGGKNLSGNYIHIVAYNGPKPSAIPKGVIPVKVNSSNEITFQQNWAASYSDIQGDVTLTPSSNYNGARFLCAQKSN